MMTGRRAGCMEGRKSTATAARGFILTPPSLAPSHAHLPSSFLPPFLFIPPFRVILSALPHTHAH